MDFERSINNSGQLEPIYRKHITTLGGQTAAIVNLCAENSCYVVWLVSPSNKRDHVSNPGTRRVIAWFSFSDGTRAIEWCVDYAREQNRLEKETPKT